MKILFICTGNTCRSPMAEVIAKEKLKKLNVSFIKVFSAGIGAIGGQPMTQESKIALKNFSYRPHRHHSKNVFDLKLESFDKIYTMTNRHKKNMPFLRDVESATEIIGYDITDPFGQGQEIYNKTVAEVEEFVEAILAELITVEPKKKGEKRK